MDPDLIFICLQRAWEWRLGDDDPLGWSITAGYAVTAALAFLVAWRAPFAAGTRSRERAFWILMTLFLVFMTINKQLELQTTLRDLGRCVARTEGWYRQRGAVQERFVLLLAGFMAMLGLATLWWLRRAVIRNLPAVLGAVLLAAFVVVRAADIGNVGRLLRWQWLRIEGPEWIEIAGIALLLFGALWVLRKAGRTAARR